MMQNVRRTVTMTVTVEGLEPLQGCADEPLGRPLSPRVVHLLSAGLWAKCMACAISSLLVPQ